MTPRRQILMPYGRRYHAKFYITSPLAIGFRYRRAAAAECLD